VSVLSNKIAVITGASSGVGTAIALGLAREGAKLCLIGRKLEALNSIAERARTTSSEVSAHQVDLTNGEEIRALVGTLTKNVGSVDLLVHSAGAIALGSIEDASVNDLDQQYLTNVRGPYVLTQGLLPMLIESRGQIVFINSSAGVAAKANAAQYSATKHALKGFADALRDEVNEHGVRVLSIFLGRTATPMQAAVHRVEGKTYQPERLIQPEDVASVVINSLALPRTAEVTDVSIRPLTKPS